MRELLADWFLVGRLPIKLVPKRIGFGILFRFLDLSYGGYFYHPTFYCLESWLIV